MDWWLAIGTGVITALVFVGGLIGGTFGLRFGNLMANGTYRYLVRRARAHRQARRR